MTPTLSVDDVISDITQDLYSPKSTTFINNISNFQETVKSLHETFYADTSTLAKIKKSLKALHSSGMEHMAKQLALCDLLDNLSDTGLYPDLEVELQEVGSGICKYSVVLRDLAMRYQVQMRQLTNFVLFPLNTFLKDTLTHDTRKPFEKSVKEFYAKVEKVRKDRIQAAKEAGLAKTSAETAVTAEDTEKEKKLMQLHLCEFLISVNELHSKKGAEFLLHLIDFFQIQKRYFQEGRETMEHLGIFLCDLQDKVSAYKASQDEQKRSLIHLRDEIKRCQQTNSSTGSTSRHSIHMLESSPLSSNPVAGGGSGAGNGVPGVGFSLHPREDGAAVGTEISGVLYKRSEGKVKRQWLKRRVSVRNAHLYLYHGDKEKTPIALPLLTCQLKDVLSHNSSSSSSNTNSSSASSSQQQQQQNNGDGTGDNEMSSTASLCFDLVSNNRTYHFMAEREADKRRWMSVLHNATEQVFHSAMLNSDVAGGAPYSPSSTTWTPKVAGEKHGVRRTPAIMSQSCYQAGGGLGLDDNSPTAAAASSLAAFCHPRVVEAIRALPGNDVCADCDRKNPDWVSINLGILICLECCGVHRQLGVHLSRTQSLAIDNLSPIELLLPRFIGNTMLNDVYEATLPSGTKPMLAHVAAVEGEVNGMQQRKTFILAKYKDRAYVSRINAGNEEDLYRDLFVAIRHASLSGLLQVHGEACELLRPLPASVYNEDEQGNSTALHIAVFYGGFSEDAACSHTVRESRRADPQNLACIAFLLQNSSHSEYLSHANASGENVLHFCAKYDHPEALKLILKACGLSNKMLKQTNNSGQTPLEVAQTKGHQECAALLRQLTSMIEAQDKSRATSNNNSSSGGHNSSIHRGAGLSGMLPVSSNWDFVMDLNTTWFDSDTEDEDYEVLTPTPRMPTTSSVRMAPVVNSRVMNLGLSTTSTMNSTSSRAALPQVPAPNVPPFIASPSSNLNKPRLNKAESVGRSDHHHHHPRASATEHNSMGVISSTLNAPKPRYSSPDVVMLRANTTSTAPRKKNPAPSPPNTAPVPAAAAHLQVPKPRGSTALATSSQTLPRKLSAGRNGGRSTSSGAAAGELHFVREVAEDATLVSSNPLSQHSHSNEHIDVILDVLEEPSPFLTLHHPRRQSAQSQGSTPLIPQALPRSAGIHTQGPAGPAPLMGVPRRVRALYDCEAECSEDLAFHHGDILVITGTAFPNWWCGYLERDPSKMGIFPANYVSELATKP